ncbi:MAG: response regulator transcription factor [Deltaproteobacteria bacterium]|nr:response regulator transcription factor [Deltaproteobacteria bacterium]
MKILVVEDEPALARALADALDDAGFVVEHVSNGEEALHLGGIEPYDAVVLDLGLPLLDGVTVLQRWRAGGVTVPVLVLTARGRWPEKLAAFSAGADDYVTKPFEIQEVIVRLRALLRRAGGTAAAEFACGPVRLDPSRGSVTVNGTPVRLTERELRILEYLLHRRGHIVSRLDIVDHVYHRDHDRDSNVIDVLIGRIRKKLGVNVIETVRGLGYRIDEPEEAMS